MKTNQKISSHTTEQNDRVTVLEQEVARLSALVSWYEEQFRLKKSKEFGRSSEKAPKGQMEMELFNEAEALLDASAEPSSEPEEVISGSSPAKKTPRETRTTFSADLPVESVTYSLPPEEQACLDCGHPMHVMKKEVRRELVVIPAQVKVVEHEREVYACRHCDQEGIQTPIVQAPMPNPVLPKSMASPSILSFLITQKYLFGMPLYRLEEVFRQAGAPLSRQTLSNWLMNVSDRWFEPLYENMRQRILSADYLHADETSVQVLREKGRSPSTTSYMWLYRTGKFDVPCVVYDYQPGRGSEYPKQFLEGYAGTLHVDGYKAYESLQSVRLSGCWAHLRRKFDEALRAIPKKSKRRRTLTEEAVNQIGKIYGAESEIKELTPSERLEVRKKKIEPLVEAFFAWVKTVRIDVLPKSKLGEALTYAVNQEKKLRQPFLDGYLEIDNNRAERSIKPFVIGRKNWLFSVTPRGATASARMYSLIVTAKENQLHIPHYLTYLLEKLPNLDLADDEQLEQLMPWSSTLPEQCYQGKEGV
ncbi:IS66 family transposase [Sporosarcina sp. PTS2304]|uniref:IS66 family transposase n=1 Tax=Sporosarcina sp. PTS2304 TaxID=2283194 RepID=UPI000E0DC974|nr:IS66 family transposase [Sporosarcina sp. PTS2304]AXI01294.1 IS66 family transposase [Sporosarcina sp. PTS2304]